MELQKKSLLSAHLYISYIYIRYWRWLIHAETEPEVGEECSRDTINGQSCCGNAAEIAFWDQAKVTLYAPEILAEWIPKVFRLPSTAPGNCIATALRAKQDDCWTRTRSNRK